MVPLPESGFVMLSIVSTQKGQGRGEVPTSNDQHPENNQIRKQNSARVIAPEAVLGYWCFLEFGCW
jgi:hypothetical protein